MKNTKKLIAIFTALLLLLFAACNNEKNSDNTNNKDNNEPGIADTDGSISESQIGYASLPAVDYEGTDFVIANLSGYTWVDVTLDVEAAEAGEMLNDAIYRRNRGIEEKYNVLLKLIDIPFDQMAANIKTHMLAGYCEYDIMQAPMRFAIAPLSVDNYIADASKLEKLDLSNPWWDNFAHANTSILGKQFFLYGDFTIADKEYTAAMVVNKDMQKEYGLPDYYQFVRDGTWTLDTMLESMKVVTKDLDGNDRWTKDDQYGLVGNLHSQMAVFYGAGENIIKKDSDDMPYLVIKNESYLNAFTRVCEFLNTDKTTADAFKLGTNEEIMFCEGKSLFASVLVATVRAPNNILREMEYQFGLLPMPKLDEKQGRYYHFLDGSTPCVAILNNDHERNERAGVLLEALSAKSSEEVQPKYREYALPLKYFRDEESFEMLDIILKSRIFDMAVIYGWGNLDGNDGRMRTLLAANKPDQLISTIEKYLPIAEEAMATDIEKLLTVK